MKMPGTVLALIMLSAQVAAAPLSASRAGNMQTALDDLSTALLNHGYTLVKVQPVDQALVKRGFADPGIRLAFVGKEEQVRQALASDPALLNLLPLRLTLEDDQGRVRISSDDLAMWRENLPSSVEVLQEWEDELAAILSDYAGQ
jgi:uncharacterized protein (DUF302 family)